MPKKGKKTKKKSTVVVKPEINIVEEGESSFDVTDVVRQKKAAAAALASSQPPQLPLEIGIESAEEITDANNVLNNVANNFSIHEVTDMRTLDSLSVMRKQDSINSNFSYFSDNNLTARDDLEDIEDDHFQESTLTSEETLADVVIETENKNHEIQEILSEKYEKEQTVCFKEESVHEEKETKIIWSQTDEKRFTDEDETPDGFLDELKEELSVQDIKGSTEEVISWSNIETERFTGQSEERDSFLENLKVEMEVGHEEKQDNLGKKNNSKIGWDNIVLKKEITLGLKEFRDFDEEKKAHDVWKENFQNLSEINEKILKERFHDAPFVSFDPDRGFGVVSTSNIGNNTEIKTGGAIGKNFEEVYQLHAYSDIFQMARDGKDESERRFILFRHFLQLSKLSEEEKDTLIIFAFNDYLTYPENCHLVKPILVTEEYVVTETFGYSSFLVASDIPFLPLSTKLMPFLDENLTLHVVASTNGSSAVRRIIKENPGWKKCGYETPNSLKNGTEYEVEVFGAVEALKLDLNCSIFASAQFPTIQVSGHDFIELAISTENQTPVKATVSLYDELRVDIDAPSYVIKKTPNPALSNVKIDEVTFGKISNIEPLLASVRMGCLTTSQLNPFLTAIGHENLIEESSKDFNLKDAILTWKNHSEGNSLEDLTDVLDKENLGFIADEIRSNHTINLLS